MNPSPIFTRRKVIVYDGTNEIAAANGRFTDFHNEIPLHFPVPGLGFKIPILRCFNRANIEINHEHCQEKQIFEISASQTFDGVLLKRFFALRAKARRNKSLRENKW
jgi:hypothetical protein